MIVYFFLLRKICKLVICNSVTLTKYFCCKEHFFTTYLLIVIYHQHNNASNVMQPKKSQKYFKNELRWQFLMKSSINSLIFFRLKNRTIKRLEKCWSNKIESKGKFDYVVNPEIPESTLTIIRLSHRHPDPGVQALIFPSWLCIPTVLTILIV